MVTLLFGILLFLLIHLVPQKPSLKDRLATRLGMIGYRTLHGLVALSAIILIVVGYFEARYEVDLLVSPNLDAPFGGDHDDVRLYLFVRSAISRKNQTKTNLSPCCCVEALGLFPFARQWTLADVVLFGFFLFYAVSYRISLKQRIAAGLVVVPVGRWVHDLFALLLGLTFYLLMVLWLHEWAFGVVPFL